MLARLLLDSVVKFVEQKEAMELLEPWTGAEFVVVWERGSCILVLDKKYGCFIIAKTRGAANLSLN